MIGLTFRGAAAPPWNNGAGIRLESGSLTVEDSRFIGNENGILTGADPRGRLTVRRSRFEGNGKCEPDCAHGLYAGLLADLTIEDSLFVGQRIGHHIKSRAARTTVVRTWIDDGAEGTASYLIDLPNAGDALIADNRLRKGRRSDNRRIAINMGTAEPLHARRRLILRGNDIASDIDRPVTLVRDRSGADIVIDGNRLAGRFELPPTR